MSTQLTSLSKQVFNGSIAKVKSGDVFFRTQSRNATFRKKLSTVDDFHHEIFNIVQSNIKEQPLNESHAGQFVSESNIMNSSENIFREGAEEVLEANTYNNSDSSEKNANKKNLKNVSEMMKISPAKLSGSGLEQGTIQMVHIRGLRTR